eukprot:scpid100950/ scgid16222/ 
MHKRNRQWTVWFRLRKSLVEWNSYEVIDRRLRREQRNAAPLGGPCVSSESGETVGGEALLASPVGERPETKADAAPQDVSGKSLPHHDHFHYRGRLGDGAMTPRIPATFVATNRL